LLQCSKPRLGGNPVSGYTGDSASCCFTAPAHSGGSRGTTARLSVALEALGERLRQHEKINRVWSLSHGTGLRYLRQRAAVR
jgi:hypothetical protein